LPSFWIDRRLGSGCGVDFALRRSAGATVGAHVGNLNRLPCPSDARERETQNPFRNDDGETKRDTKQLQRNQLNMLLRIQSDSNQSPN
jgi:hypothetical protein